MKYCRNLNECCESVPEAVNANKWAKICKIVGWVIVGLFSLVGIIIAVNAYDAGFAIFLGSVAGGFLIASGFWILGSVLDALASSAQSNAETARLIYYRIQADAEEPSAKRNGESQLEQAAHYSKGEGAYYIQQDSSAPESNLNVPTTAWKCPKCGAENRAYYNVCTGCGAVVKVAPQAND